MKTIGVDERCVLILTELGSMYDLLVKTLPVFDFIRETVEEECPEVSLSPEFNIEEIHLLIDKLLLNGALCILHAELKEIRYLGLICWSIATKLP